MKKPARFHGIVPLLKPAGMTSNDCVIAARKIFGQRQIGHSGTLDPAVVGVLPLCLGNATKIVNYLMASGKVYRGQLILGMASETEDLEGKIIERKELARPFSVEEINAAMASLTGTITQIPPMYSAVKVNGKRLYEYARANEEVTRPKRQVEVRQFIQLQPPVYDEQRKVQTVSFQVACGKGTYVRTLAVDLGKKLGVPALMSKLIRTKAAGFEIVDAVSLDKLTELKQQNQLVAAIKPISVALQKYPRQVLRLNQWQRVKNGAFLAENEIMLRPLPEQIVFCYQNKVRCIYQHNPQKNRYQAKTMIDLND